MADHREAMRPEDRPVRACRNCGCTLRQHVYAGYAEACDDFEEREDDAEVLARVDNLVADYLMRKDEP